jgi:inorganic pyrophosphatase
MKIKQRDLSHLAGTWSEEEVQEFERNTAYFSALPQDTNVQFWLDLEQLVSSSTLHIDRPKGSSHPQYTDLIYPFDYGELEGTTGGDGAGIDVWVGSLEKTVTGILATVDTVKRDSETKILLGCSGLEMQQIRDWYNNVAKVQCFLIIRSL